MARVSARARPERERVLVPARQACPGCGGHMRLRYENRRNLVTLSGAVIAAYQAMRGVAYSYSPGMADPPGMKPVAG